MVQILAGYAEHRIEVAHQLLCEIVKAKLDRFPAKVFRIQETINADG